MMHLLSSGVSVVHRQLARDVVLQDRRAMSSGDTRAATVCLALLVATLWLATRPYSGAVQDSRFYTLQALSALQPGRFANDLYFRYGSQDQFTAFTSLYKPVLAALGIAKAAILLTIAGQCCWITGLVYLARGIFRAHRTALLAVAMAVVLPSGVILNYGEPFLTPRLVAEAVSLWALGSMLRGRPILALLLLGVSAMVHPLMTLPGFAALFLYQGGRRPVWWGLGAGAVVAALGLAYAGVQPFVRLSESFDPAWFAVVRVRDYFCLLTAWNWFDWLRTGNLLVVAALGMLLAEPHERRVLGVMLAVALGGLAATMIGGDLLHNVLVVDAQQYRATWLLAVVANLCIGPLLLRMRGAVVSPFTRAAVLWSVAMLIVTAFIGAGYVVTLPSLVLAGLAALWEQRRQRPLPDAVQAVGVVILGLLCGITLAGIYAFMTLSSSWPSEFWQTARGLGLVGAALSAMAVLLTAAIAGRRTAIRPLLGFAIGLAVIAALGWDQRTPWTRFVETADAAPPSLTALLPAQKAVYWEGDVRMPWFVLRRPSYFSCAQGTGALFFRGTALDYQHRHDTLQPLRTLDYGQETTCPAPPGPQPVAAARAELAAVCAREPELGALVLTQPATDAPGRVWVAPASFEDVRSIDGKIRLFSTDRFFVYRCADLH